MATICDMTNKQIKEQQRFTNAMVAEGCRQHGALFARLVRAFLINPFGLFKKLIQVMGKVRVVKIRVKYFNCLKFAKYGDDLEIPNGSDWIEFLFDVSNDMTKEEFDSVLA